MSEASTNNLSISDTKKLLLSLGITNVVLSYSGSGDSSFIEVDDFLDREGFSKTNFPPLIEEKVRKTLEDWACSNLEHAWETDEGSEGNIKIDIIESKVIIDHYKRVLTYENSVIEKHLG